MERVIECCDWLVSAEREYVSGRNFSLVHDTWGSDHLNELLKTNSNMYKLRREGNNMNNIGNSSRDATPEDVLRSVWSLIKSDVESHIPGSKQYAQLKSSARYAAQSLFNQSTKDGKEFCDFGKISLPYYKMGSVDSIDLFGIDELIIFAFYWKNKSNYRKICDVGANIGLHSLLLAKCGYKVKSYEPDPVHIRKILENLEMNNVSENVEIVEAAVSDVEGNAEFIRILGNTTGSHIAGSKENPYGEMERFEVKLKPISELMEWADFIKIDAEGHETQILLGTTASQWAKTDAMVEIGSIESAELIFDHLSSIGIRIFTQKIGWEQAKSSSDLPISHLEGSAFVTSKEKMPW